MNDKIVTDNNQADPQILGQRLDRWLRRRGYCQDFNVDQSISQNISQGQIEKWCRQRKILINGKPAKASTRVTEQDNVEFAKGFLIENHLTPQTSTKPPQKTSYSPADISFLESLILWEDSEICVINKPAGLAVQGGTKTNYHLDGLLQAYGKATVFRLVHRIDKDTSGVLVVAKTLAKSIQLATAFQERSVKKVYWALVEGIPNPHYGSITAPLLKSAEGGGFDKVAVDDKQGQRAHTDYRVIKSLNRQTTWVELCPLTGRMHQLRVHCSFIGHPILGDRKYGSTINGPLCLHARQLTIPDTVGGKTLTFNAPPPKSMAEIFKKYKIDWQNYC